MSCLLMFCVGCVFVWWLKLLLDEERIEVGVEWLWGMECCDLDWFVECFLNLVGGIDDEFGYVLLEMFFGYVFWGI